GDGGHAHATQSCSPLPTRRRPPPPPRVPQRAARRRAAAAVAALRRRRRELHGGQRLPGQHTRPRRRPPQERLRVPGALRQGRRRRRAGRRLRARALPRRHQCLLLRGLRRRRLPERAAALRLQPARHHVRRPLHPPLLRPRLPGQRHRQQRQVRRVQRQQRHRGARRGGVRRRLRPLGQRHPPTMPPGTRPGGFGTGEAGHWRRGAIRDPRRNPQIYSLGAVQRRTWRRLPNCRSCLRDIIREVYPTVLRREAGWESVRPWRCNFPVRDLLLLLRTAPLLQLPDVLARLHQRPAPASAAEDERTRNRTGLILAITLPIVAALLLISTCVCFWRRRKSAERKPSVPLPYSATNPDDIQSIDSLLLDLSTLRAATDNFAESNKLGEGGFGAVYKGVLSEGEEIAVKRLSQSSTQGIEELKTELVLVAKLQHKNLVRLLGVCLEGQEKLLVYEYMPNRSLDTVLFDAEKSRGLDWGKRLKIVNGVARGLQYLHEDSQLRIVHRDLKASNVLLDSDCNPKISDFGLAKLFGWDQSQAVTSHIAGTYGYMAPEYAMRGQYSVKSDAFSFGVLLLEIVTGRKNSSFASPDSEPSLDLLSLVWEHWTTGTVEELVDPSLGGRSPGGQMLKLVNIGLLCVQDSPADRPTMSAVNVMLSSSTVSLQAPSRPTFCVDDMEGFSGMYSGAYPRGSQSTGDSKPQAAMSPSPNEVSLTEIEPR
ncbi:hypothetical protein CFC21_029263, partial [Triticum aestivum]